MHRRIGLGGAAALGLSVFLAVPAAQAKQPETARTTPAATATINVPSGFDKNLADTRINGHYAVVGTGLHIWTDGSTDVDPTTGKNSDKVAEYVDTNTPLAAVGDPSLDFTPTDPTAAPGIPGFQLVVDLDGDKQADGILVGEPAHYGADWWLANASPAFLASIDPTVLGTAAAPGANDGYEHSGPLAEWQKDFPSAQVLAFGFSLGSGVHGNGTLNAISFGDASYTFAVILTSKDQCKGGGWATSTLPVYKNQGECVSSFARVSNNGNGNVNDKNVNDKNVNDKNVNGTGATGLGAPVSTATGSTAPIVRTPRNSGKIRAI